MRRVRYSVAMSLDGYIAGPNGEYDWIVTDKSIDFAAFFKTIDAVLLGRKTYELALAAGPKGGMPGMDVHVFSTTLRPEDHPDVTVHADAVAAVPTLRERPGKDIWLMGGGVLFRGLLAAGLVDAVEVSVVPVLLGGGLPLLPPPAATAKLKLAKTHTYPSGVISLSYEVRRDPS
jgi:dihydrofolate reductase